MKILATTILLLCLGVFVFAQDADQTNNSKNTSELQAATATVEHMSANAGDNGIPNTVFEGAKCVAVIPKLIKGAFVVGGEHGDGVATCRVNGGAWSAPAPFKLSGVSWGPQIGGKSTDLLMFIMNNEGMTNLLAGHFKLGADVSAAAGPVGRSASADAAWKAGVLTYSSSKGAFIGASLNGAEIQQDNRATQDWYGSNISFKEILTGGAKIPNQQAKAFVDAVQNAKQSAQLK